MSQEDKENEKDTEYYDLGLRYLNGLVPKAEVLESLKTAADQGNGAAQIVLGICSTVSPESAVASNTKRTLEALKNLESAQKPPSDNKAAYQAASRSGMFAHSHGPAGGSQPAQAPAQNQKDEGPKDEGPKVGGGR